LEGAVSEKDSASAALDADRASIGDRAFDVVAATVAAYLEKLDDEAKRAAMPRVVATCPGGDADGVNVKPGNERLPTAASWERGRVEDGRARERAAPSPRAAKDLSRAERAVVADAVLRAFEEMRERDERPRREAEAAAAAKARARRFSESATQTNDERVHSRVNAEERRETVRGDVRGVVRPWGGKVASDGVGRKGGGRVVPPPPAASIKR